MAIPSVEPRTAKAPSLPTVDVVRRATPPVVAGGVLAVLLVRMAWSAGGYFPSSYLGAGTIALAVAGALLLAARPTYLFSAPALLALASLAGLALWTGLSSLWSSAPSGAIDAMQRDLAYIAILVLAMLAAGSGRYARHVVWLALGVTFVICGGGLLSRLLPGWIGHDAATDGARLAYPLTYWNAFGALSAMGSVLALGLAGDPSTRWRLRATAAAGSVLLLAAMALSESRGSWLALFAGLAVLVAMSRHRGSIALTAGIIGLGWVLLLLRLRGYPSLTSDPATVGSHAADGRAYAAQVVLIAAAVAAAVGFIGAARASERVMAGLRRTLRPVFLAGAVIVALVLAGLYLTHTTRAEGTTNTGADRASHWISRQWHDFMSASAAPGSSGLSRVTQGSGGTRSTVYRVALDAFGDHPLAGAGGGSFKIYWFARRPIGERVVNAHSLELETLAELGIVGLALLAVFLGAIASAAVRARLKPGGLSRGQVAAVTGACTVWFVHSAVDWDWQMPAVTGVFFMLACTVFPYGRHVRPSSKR